MGRFSFKLDALTKAKQQTPSQYVQQWFSTGRSRNHFHKKTFLSKFVCWKSPKTLTESMKMIKMVAFYCSVSFSASVNVYLGSFCGEKYVAFNLIHLYVIWVSACHPGVMVNPDPKPVENHWCRACTSVCWCHSVKWRVRLLCLDHRACAFGHNGAIF